MQVIIVTKFLIVKKLYRWFDGYKKPVFVFVEYKSLRFADLEQEKSIDCNSNLISIWRLVQCAWFLSILSKSNTKELWWKMPANIYWKFVWRWLYLSTLKRYRAFNSRIVSCLVDSKEGRIVCSRGINLFGSNGFSSLGGSKTWARSTIMVYEWNRW